ncbi:MAG: dephospho-CoA kinase, partial [Gammaproteobacteria bacterium]
MSLDLPWTVALTGGIASGKSAVANAFTALGICVIDTDLIARELVQPGQPALTEIMQRWGTEMLLPSGELDRRALRTQIFAHPNEKKELEAILHPRIRAEVLRLRQNCTSDYAVVVIPLLLETGQADQYDRVLVVDCIPEQQRQRVAARDGSSATEIDAILAAQVDRTTRLAAADDIIENSEDQSPEQRQQYLQDAVARLHRQYLDLSRAA